MRITFRDSFIKINGRFTDLRYGRVNKSTVDTIYFIIDDDYESSLPDRLQYILKKRVPTKTAKAILAVYLSNNINKHLVYRAGSAKY